MGPLIRVLSRRHCQEIHVAPSPTDSETLVASYGERASQFAQDQQQLSRQANRISHGRVATFLAGGFCFLAAGLAQSGAAIWLAAGLVAMGGFGAARVVVRPSARRGRTAPPTGRD